MNDKAIIIADTLHTQRWSERGVDPMLSSGDLAFLCNFLTTLENLRLWAHEHALGIPQGVKIWKQSILRMYLVPSPKTIT